MLFSKTIAALKAKIQQFKDENFKLRGGKPSERKPTPPDPKGQELHLFPAKVHELNAELQAEQEENAKLKAKASPAPAPVAAPPIASPAPTPPAPAAKPATTPAPMTAIPSALKPAAASVASTPKFDVAKDSKFMHRAAFDALGFKERNEFIRGKGHIVEMTEGQMAKHAAADSIQHINDSIENIAEALVIGFGLKAETEGKEVLTEWAATHRDENLREYTEARIASALAGAQKSTKPVGFLLPGAQPVDQSRHNRSRRNFPVFKTPDEVSEPDRLKAEDALMALWAEFDKISDVMVRAVWWEKHRDEVFGHAVNETRRGSRWLGTFIAKIPHENLYIS